MGERDRGIRLLDEAMAGVTAGEVSPSVAGMVYCATIQDCYAIFDIRRAQEWTTALTDWCAAHPDLVFRGRCLIFRAELMRFHGDWTSAADEVQRARLVLAGRRSIRPSPTPTTKRPSSTVSGAASRMQNASTPRPARSAIDASRASPSSGSPRVGPLPPTT